MQVVDPRSPTDLASVARCLTATNDRRHKHRPRIAFTTEAALSRPKRMPRSISVSVAGVRMQAVYARPTVPRRWSVAARRETTDTRSVEICTYTRTNHQVGGEPGNGLRDIPLVFSLSQMLAVLETAHGLCYPAPECDCPTHPNCPRVPEFLFPDRGR